MLTERAGDGPLRREMWLERTPASILPPDRWGMTRFVGPGAAT